MPRAKLPNKSKIDIKPKKKSRIMISTPMKSKIDIRKKKETKILMPEALRAHMLEREANLLYTRDMKTQNKTEDKTENETEVDMFVVRGPTAQRLNLPQKQNKPNKARVPTGVPVTVPVTVPVVDVPVIAPSPIKQPRVQEPISLPKPPPPKTRKPPLSQIQPEHQKVEINRPQQRRKRNWRVTTDKLPQAFNTKEAVEIQRVQQAREAAKIQAVVRGQKARKNKKRVEIEKRLRSEASKEKRERERVATKIQAKINEYFNNIKPTSKRSMPERSLNRPKRQIRSAPAHAKFFPDKQTNYHEKTNYHENNYEPFDQNRVRVIYVPLGETENNILEKRHFLRELEIGNKFTSLFGHRTPANLVNYFLDENLSSDPIVIQEQFDDVLRILTSKAATTIQKKYRGKKARKYIRQRKQLASAATTVQATLRKRSALAMRTRLAEQEQQRKRAEEERMRQREQFYAAERRRYHEGLRRRAEFNAAERRRYQEQEQQRKKNEEKRKKNEEKRKKNEEERKNRERTEIEDKLISDASNANKNMIKKVTKLQTARRMQQARRIAKARKKEKEMDRIVSALKKHPPLKRYLETKRFPGRAINRTLENPDIKRYLNLKILKSQKSNSDNINRQASKLLSRLSGREKLLVKKLMNDKYFIEKYIQTVPFSERGLKLAQRAGRVGIDTAWSIASMIGQGAKKGAEGLSDWHEQRQQAQRNREIEQIESQTSPTRSPRPQRPRRSPSPQRPPIPYPRRGGPYNRLEYSPPKRRP